MKSNIIFLVMSYMLASCASTQAAEPTAVSQNRTTNLVVRNRTKLNLALSYIKDQSEIWKVIVPDEIADLGPIGKVAQLNFFAFAKSIPKVFKRVAVPSCALEHIDTYHISRLKNKNFVLTISYDNGFETGISVEPVESTLPKLKSGAIKRIGEIFRGIDTRRDVKHDRVSHYILGVLEDPTLEDLNGAYTGLVNQWTWMHELHENNLMNYSQDISEINKKLSSCPQNKTDLELSKSQIERKIELETEALKKTETYIQQIQKAYKNLLELISNKS